MRHRFRCGPLVAMMILPAIAVAQEGQSPGSVPADGAVLAQACVTCHGPNAEGGGAFPPLAGRDAGDLLALMTAFRADDAAGTIMPRLLSGFSDAEIAALATYLASLEAIP